MTGKPGKIVKKVWIRASKDVVFRALTESKELVEWFCERASMDAREGGELSASWKSGKNSPKGRALITRLVPGSRLELLWVDEGNGPKENGPAHTLCYEIRTKSGMTELVMTDIDESGVESEELAILDQGWNTVLVDLRDHCERKERSAKLHSSGPKTRGTLSE